MNTKFIHVENPDHELNQKEIDEINELLDIAWKNIDNTIESNEIDKRKIKES